MKAGLAAMAAGWLLGAPAFGHPTSTELSALFARGAYMEAAQLAERRAGADDLAFAARALLAEVVTGDNDPDPAKVERAKRDAEAALRLDPGHEEGRLQLAIALSLQSRAMDAMSAWTSGYGQKGLKLAREVLEQDPGNVFAHGFLSVWNVEVRRRGGTVGAGMLGASLKDAREHYQAACRLDPDYVGIHWAYGRALASLDARKYGDEAVTALEKALAAKADDHVESVMQERARQLLGVLKTDRRAGQALALKML